MPVAGRKAKPEGQKRNHHAPTHEWTDVLNVPFEGGPDLPDDQGWPAMTRRWWKVVSAMPQCALWTEADWGFAFDTALLAAKFHAGEVRLATELRNREKVLGTTMDFRRDLRIRYVDHVEQTEGDADVTKLDDYRDAI